jgi:hypothetical protein
MAGLAVVVVRVLLAHRVVKILMAAHKEVMAEMV